MRFVFLSAIKDFRRMRRDPLALATWFGIPLLVSLMLVAFFGREQPKPHGLVMISDQDKSFLSAVIMHAYTQDKLGEMFTVQQVPLEEGRRRIYSGDGSALVIIPEGFSQAVFGNRKAEMQLITNPTQSILPGIVESVTSILVEGAWRLQQLVGDDLKQLAGKERPSDETIAASSIRFSRLGESLQKYLDPPIIKVAVDLVDPNKNRSGISMSQAMFPSMTFMAVLFLAVGLANEIWKERMNGTLRHVAMTPGSIAGFLGGKFLTLFTIFAMVGVVALVSGKYLIGTETHNAVPAVLWIAFCGGAGYVLFVFLHTLFRNERGATTLSIILMMMLGMLGGCFFPFEIMPDTLAKIGRWMPNGWALLRFSDILAGRADATGLAVAFGGILGFTAILFAITARRLRRNFLF